MTKKFFNSIFINQELTSKHIHFDTLTMNRFEIEVDRNLTSEILVSVVATGTIGTTTKIAPANIDSFQR